MRGKSSCVNSLLTQLCNKWLLHLALGLRKANPDKPLAVRIFDLSNNISRLDKDGCVCVRTCVCVGGGGGGCVRVYVAYEDKFVL